MELTAASTATSVAVTALPGDAATPLAEKLADLSSAFLIVLAALYLEKYLVTITGYAAFVIPILVLFFFVWLIKIILGVNINVPMNRLGKGNKL